MLILKVISYGSIEGNNMNLRHIQAFIAVAEELHFGRAAKRLHIEQSPLSRIIRKLEADLGVTLFHRTARGTRLTWAGQVFLEDAHRIMLTFEQAQTRARATAVGYQGVLRIALSGDIGRTRLAALLALCREEAPKVSIRLFEVSLAQLMAGLDADLFDAGLATLGEVDGAIVAAPLWEDPFMVALPARHPLLAFKEVPLEEMVGYPLILCDPHICEGCSRQRERLFRMMDGQPTVAEYVSTHSLMLTFVAAGYGVGFSSAAHLEGCHQADVVARPLADQAASLTTYLLRPEGEIMEPLRQFIDRAKRVGRAQGGDQPPA
jgi:DNA-binding transcriptional LysR family regulator